VEDIEISLKEAKRIAEDSPEKYLIVDVRTPEECQSIPSPFRNSVRIELKDLPLSLSLIEKEKEILLLCRSGTRSLIATQFLRMSGYNAKNIHGGILG
jgi:rhodanese-related sulfurtransferase